jgi:hypothetical protein
MKTHRTLALVAIVIFVISHCLPAYGDGSGFASFQYCWQLFLGHDDIKPLTGGWFYYSGFVLANILFIALAGTLFITSKSRKLRLAVSIVCFLQVLSWFVLNISSGKLSQVTEIKLGYYVWLSAYGLLVAAHLLKEPVASTGSIPLAPSAV